VNLYRWDPAFIYCYHYCFVCEANVFLLEGKKEKGKKRRKKETPFLTEDFFSFFLLSLFAVFFLARSVIVDFAVAEGRSKISHKSPISIETNIPC